MSKLTKLKSREYNRIKMARFRLKMYFEERKSLEQALTILENHTQKQELSLVIEMVQNRLNKVIYLIEKDYPHHLINKGEL